MSLSLTNITKAVKHFTARQNSLSLSNKYQPLKRMTEYLSALFKHWLAFMGAAMLLIGFGLRICRRKPADIPGRILICIGLGFFFWSGYAAWQDKNQVLNKLEEKLKTPQLAGKLLSCGNISYDEQPMIIISGAITNPLGPPTGISDLKMTVDFGDGKVFDGVPPLISGKYIEIPLPKNIGSLILPPSDYLPKKCALPIPSGGLIEGWFWSVFSNLDIEEAYKQKATIVLEFKDIVSNNPHRLSYQLKDRGVRLPGFRSQATQSNILSVEEEK